MIRIYSWDDLPKPDKDGVIHLEPNTKYRVTVPRNKETDEAWERLRKSQND